MKRIGTLTLHRAQNYGSALQAYALQAFLAQLSREAKEPFSHCVIDAAPPVQKEIYALYQKGAQPKALVKNAVALYHRRALRIKHEKFERFVEKNMPLSEMCEASDLVKIADGIDVLLCGSDQIWNVRAKDFAPWFYADFQTKAKKVSYAASFGPLEIDWRRYDAQKIAACIAKFDAISVREQASADQVQHLCQKDAQVHVDPTLLLAVEDWRRVQSDADYQKGQYILLYCLEPTRAQLSMAKRISKRLHLPILVTKYNNKHDICNPFVKRYDCGPEDFLSYVDHAALVLTSSYHGTLFSVLYQKPFYVLDAQEDRRISHFLGEVGLSERILSFREDLSCVTLTLPDDTRVQAYIQEQRKSSREYLCRALEISL